jgi:starch phosphorylase
MARLTPRFSANRTVREYTERYYLPAANAYHSRVAESGALGSQLLQWQCTLDHGWPTIRFGDLRVATASGDHVFHAEVFLGEISLDAVHVEIYCDGCGGNGAVCEPMTPSAQLTGSINGYVFTARVAANRPASHYTPRVVPYQPHAAVPLEAAQILWR